MNGNNPVTRDDLDLPLLPGTTRRRTRFSLMERLKKDKWLLLLALPGLLYYIVFRYFPMFGIVMAFQDFSIRDGIFGSDFVGLKNIRMFINHPSFWMLLKNTVLLGLLSVVLTLPVAVLFAVLLTEIKSRLLSRFTQSIALMPYFIATVVIVGIAINMLAPETGLINRLIEALGGESIHFIQEPGWFRPIYIITEIWQKNGWLAVVFIAAILGIDQQLYEASAIDGAGRLKKLIHITIPLIFPIIAIMFVLRVGQIMNLSFEKTILLQNPLNYATSDIIDTYIYRRGFLHGDISYASAVDLFKGAVSLLFALGTNYVTKRLTSKSAF
ncbi:ABC transporter permease [Paenibacillus koleovorans]|uniref:ABC transporter permease n=1 Tax=Paenibacillus koleovorans TaxID=121608 RepID=UPI000FD7ECF8|nr:ABC transporter permease subunit [Paenibacillus koleovorans]